MSKTLYVLDNLEPPFARLMERTFLVAPRGQWVRTPARKIIFIVSGQATHRFGDDLPRPLGPGDILISADVQGQFYQIRDTNSPGRIQAVVLSLDSSLLPLVTGHQPPPFLSDTPESERLAFFHHHFQRNHHLRGACNSAIWDALNELRSEAQLRPQGYRMRVSALCANLSVLTARCLRQESASFLPEAPGRSADYLARHAKDFLHSRLTMEVTLTHVAAHLGISEEHLSRTFKQVTGQSVLTYLRTARLEYAKSLLVNTNENVSQIADRCGFNSLATFSRGFKEYTGYSPLTYRSHYGADLRR